MRTMLTVSMPVEPSSQAIKDDTLSKTFAQAAECMKPEASYFRLEHGKRTALFFFDLKDVSDMPVIAELFFMNLNAEVDFAPVMNADDLQAGLGKASERPS